MKLVCAFTPGYLADETRDLVLSLGGTLVDVSASEESYFEMFERLWAEGETFINVEHDVLPAAGLLEEMDACTEEWCVGAYANGTAAVQRWHLGCMKFGSQLIRRHPQVIEWTAESGQRDWGALDGRLIGAMGRVGQVAPHQHPGSITHLHGAMHRRRGGIDLVVYEDGTYGPDEALLSLARTCEPESVSRNAPNRTLR